MAKKARATASRRAEEVLSRWGDCRDQGELFTRADLSKAKPAPAQTKSKDKR